MQVGARLADEEGEAMKALIVVVAMLSGCDGCGVPCTSGVYQLGDGDTARCHYQADMRIERTIGPVLIHCVCREANR